MSSNFLKSVDDLPRVRGGYNNGVKGRVNVRYNSKRDTYRYRFQPIHRDQAPTINAALAAAREIGGTEYDANALFYICSNFLADFSEVSARQMALHEEQCN